MQQKSVQNTSLMENMFTHARLGLNLQPATSDLILLFVSVYILFLVVRM